MRRFIAIAFSCVLMPTAVFAENRCGWLINPTPRNWTLVDAENEWTIMVQGGYAAEGMDKIKDMAEGRTRLYELQSRLCVFLHECLDQRGWRHHTDLFVPSVAAVEMQTRSGSL